MTFEFQLQSSPSCPPLPPVSWHLQGLCSFPLSSAHAPASDLPAALALPSSCGSLPCAELGIHEASFPKWHVSVPRLWWNPEMSSLYIAYLIPSSRRHTKQQRVLGVSISNTWIPSHSSCYENYPEIPFFNETFLNRSKNNYCFSGLLK